MSREFKGLKKAVYGRLSQLIEGDLESDQRTLSTHLRMPLTRELICLSVMFILPKMKSLLWHMMQIYREYAGTIGIFMN